MDEFLRSHSWVAWVGALLAFVVFVILLLHMAKILVELRRRLPRGARSRQLRLGFVENFDLDGERQLLLVRRDNVEHLLLIGGPNDVLVESGIVRVESRDIRETRGPRGGFESIATAGAAPVAPPSPAPVLSPSPVHSPSPVLAPLPAVAPETSSLTESRPAPARRDPARPEPARHQPAVDPQPEVDIVSLEDELRAAFEASPFAPAERPQAEAPQVEPPVAPPAPFASPPAPSPFAQPVPERAASRFTMPPRPSFKAPLPPSRPSPAPGAPASGAPASSESKPRFVIPPLARRNPVAPPPPSMGETPEAPRTPSFPPRELFQPNRDPEPPRQEAPAPEPAAPPQPAPPPPEEHKPRMDQDHLESLEDEMAKLLGRPPHR